MLIAYPCLEILIGLKPTDSWIPLGTTYFGNSTLIHLICLLTPYICFRSKTTQASSDHKAIQLTAFYAHQEKKNTKYLALQTNKRLKDLLNTPTRVSNPTCLFHRICKDYRNAVSTKSCDCDSFLVCDYPVIGFGLLLPHDPHFIGVIGLAQNTGQKRFENKTS